MTAPLPDWATEEQEQCVVCGAWIAPTLSGDAWVDDDGDHQGFDGHEHRPEETA